jgi:hypothetical protein
MASPVPPARRHAACLDHALSEPSTANSTASRFECSHRRHCFSLGPRQGGFVLCAARLCKLVLAEVVRDEVEENLLLHGERLPTLEAEELIEHYRRLVKLANPEIVPYPARELVQSSRHLIRHAADVPVLLSAMASKPGWLLTHNTKHSTQAVAKRTGLRIATPAEFFRTLWSLLR